MTDVSLFRLYLLRAMYLLVLVGLATTIWPGVLTHSLNWGLNQGVVASVLTAVSLLAALGIRYPLAMLPLLFFELIWKIVWLLAFALPLWRANLMDAATASTVRDCSVGIILPLVIPWGYVWRNYVKRPSDRWKRGLH